MREHLGPCSSGIDHNHICPVFLNLVKKHPLPNLSVIDFNFPQHRGSSPVSGSSQNFTEEKGLHVDLCLAGFAFI